LGLLPLWPGLSSYGKRVMSAGAGPNEVTVHPLCVGAKVTQVSVSEAQDHKVEPPPSVAAAEAARRRQLAFQRRRDRRGLLFVLPFFVIFLMFLVVPLAYSVYTSSLRHG